MVDDSELENLRRISAPRPDVDAKARAMEAGIAAFQASRAKKTVSTATQGSAEPLRLIDRAIKLWSGMMQKKLYATPAMATILALPIAGYTAYYLINGVAVRLRRRPASGRWTGWRQEGCNHSVRSAACGEKGGERSGPARSIELRTPATSQSEDRGGFVRLGECCRGRRTP